jgi:AraC family L-rhamnose operon transcriptional activator RhaR
MAHYRTRPPSPDWHRVQDQPHVDVHRIADHPPIIPHDHLCHELVFVESGTAAHKTAEGQSPIRPGDVIVIRPQIWHSYQNPRRLTIVNCLVGTQLIRRFGSLLAHVDGAFELYRRRPRRPWLKAPVVLHARPAQQQAMIDRLEAIMVELEQKPDGWRAAATVGVLDVLVMTARLSQSVSGPGSASDSTSRVELAVLDAVEFIEANYTSQIRMADLAKRVHLSEGHLSRHFSRRMGMSAIEFMHRLRAEQACLLLQSTALPVADVAAGVGYDEVAYFSRCFRKQVGRSPREYRQTYGREAP